MPILSAATVVLSWFDSVRFHIDFLTEIISNFLPLIYFHHLLFKCISLAGIHSTPSVMLHCCMIVIDLFVSQGQP